MSAPTVQARQLLAPHEAFQRRCEENTAWYVSQLHQQHESHATISPRKIALPGTTSTSNEPLTVFHSKVLPQLSLFELGCALARASKCGEEALVVSLVLMSRYCASTKTRPTAHMMHRLYVACLQVGMKAHSDVYFRNDTYARLAGISYLEMNRLENEVIRGLQWSVQVTREELEAMLAAPEEAIARMAPAALFYAATVVPRATSRGAFPSPQPQVSPTRSTPGQRVSKQNAGSSSAYLPESPKSANGSPDMSHFAHVTTDSRTPAAELNGSSMSFAEWNRGVQRLNDSRGLATSVNAESLTSP